MKLFFKRKFHFLSIGNKPGIAILWIQILNPKPFWLLDFVFASEYEEGHAYNGSIGIPILPC